MPNLNKDFDFSLLNEGEGKSVFDFFQFLHRTSPSHLAIQGVPNPPMAVALKAAEPWLARMAD